MSYSTKARSRSVTAWSWSESRAYARIYSYTGGRKAYPGRFPEGLPNRFPNYTFTVNV